MPKPDREKLRTEIAQEVAADFFEAHGKKDAAVLPTTKRQLERAVLAAIQRAEVAEAKAGLESSAERARRAHQLDRHRMLDQARLMGFEGCLVAMLEADAALYEQILESPLAYPFNLLCLLAEHGTVEIR